jgi:hypothetical protein
MMSLSKVLNPLKLLVLLPGLCICKSFMCITPAVCWKSIAVNIICQGRWMGAATVLKINNYLLPLSARDVILV